MHRLLVSSTPGKTTLPKLKHIIREAVRDEAKVGTHVKLGKIRKNNMLLLSILSQILIQRFASLRFTFNHIKERGWRSLCSKRNEKERLGPNVTSRFLRGEAATVHKSRSLRSPRSMHRSDDGILVLVLGYSHWAYPLS